MPLWQYLVFAPALIVWFFVANSEWAKLQSAIVEHLSWLPGWVIDPVPLDAPGPYSHGVLLALFVVSLLLTGIIAPVIEELYFRGYLLPRIDRLGGWAPLLNVVLFALYHLWTPLLTPGRILALLPLVYLVWWKRNIYLGIVVHCVLNLFGVIGPSIGMLGGG